MTRKEKFEAIRAMVESSVYMLGRVEILEMLDKELLSLEKKRTSTRKPGMDKVNAVISDTVLEVLTDLAKPVTITELMQDPRLSSYIVEEKGVQKVVVMTNQKLTSIIKKLVQAKTVENTVDKKRSYYSVPSADTGEVEA